MHAHCASSVSPRQVQFLHPNVRLLRAVATTKAALTSKQRHLLLGLACFLNVSSQAWPSITTLARTAGLHRDDVVACARDLAAQGVLHVAKSRGPGGANLYTVNVDALAGSDDGAEQSTGSPPASGVRPIPVRTSGHKHPDPEKNQKIPPTPQGVGAVVFDEDTGPLSMRGTEIAKVAPAPLIEIQGLAKVVVEATQAASPPNRAVVDVPGNPTKPTKVAPPALDTPEGIVARIDAAWKREQGEERYRDKRDVRRACGVLAIARERTLPGVTVAETLGVMLDNLEERIARGNVFDPIALLMSIARGIEVPRPKPIRKAEPREPELTRDEQRKINMAGAAKLLAAIGLRPPVQVRPVFAA